MKMRSQRSISHIPDDGTGRYLASPVHPRTIGLAPPGAGLAMSALTGLDAHVSREEDRFVVYVRDPGDQSRWAAATHRLGDRDHHVYQMGDRPLWDEVVDAYFQWVSWGRPHCSRCGMTVTPEGQSIWVDTPERVLTST